MSKNLQRKNKNQTYPTNVDESKEHIAPLCLWMYTKSGF